MSSWLILLKQEFLQILKAPSNRNIHQLPGRTVTSSLVPHINRRAARCCSVSLLLLHCCEQKETLSVQGEKSHCAACMRPIPTALVLLLAQEHRSVFTWLLSAARTCRKRGKAQISSNLTSSDPFVTKSLQYPSIRVQGIHLEVGFWSLMTVPAHCFNYIEANWQQKKIVLEKAVGLVQQAGHQLASAQWSTGVEHSQAALLDSGLPIRF